jgi:hypothetical protein
MMSQAAKNGPMRGMRAQQAAHQQRHAGHDEAVEPERREREERPVIVVDLAGRVLRVDAGVRAVEGAVPVIGRGHRADDDGPAEKRHAAAARAPAVARAGVVVDEEAQRDGKEGDPQPGDLCPADLARLADHAVFQRHRAKPEDGADQAGDEEGFAVKAPVPAEPDGDRRESRQEYRRDGVDRQGRVQLEALSHGRAPPARCQTRYIRLRPLERLQRNTAAL